MPYVLNANETGFSKALRRIAACQIDKALLEITDKSLTREKAIHQARKRCKKLRALIRLVEPDFPGYAVENKVFRDAARELAAIRDTDVVIATVDALLADAANREAAKRLRRVRSALSGAGNSSHDGENATLRLRAFETRMRKARKRLRHWSLDTSDQRLPSGLGESFRLGRIAMGKARQKPTPARLHAWRKRVKDHWYQTRLLLPSPPEMLRAHQRLARDLSEVLGAHQDLAVLRERVDRIASGLDPTDVRAVNRAAATRQAALVERAFELGAELYAEKPNAFGRRVRAHWMSSPPA